MTPEIFAEWLRRQGYRVRKTESSYWHDQGPRVYQAFPYHWVVEPDETELTEFLKAEKAIGLRYSTPVGARQGAISYHVIMESDAYRLEMLPKKARYDVRKGLKTAKVERISFHRMADEGWQLRFETLQRQGREKAETQSWWQKLCESTKGLPGFEAWAAITNNNQMVASLIAFVCDNTCSILYQQSLTEYLPLGVNNALTFEFSKDALSRPKIKRIFYGLHSLDAPSSVDKFKFRMRFVAKPVRQRVVFHPLARPLFNAASHALLKGLLRLRPGDATLSKAEGMVRFYRQGQIPFSEQIWPVHVEEFK